MAPSYDRLLAFARAAALETHSAESLGRMARGLIDPPNPYLFNPETDRTPTFTPPRLTWHLLPNAHHIRRVLHESSAAHDAWLNVKAPRLRVSAAWERAMQVPVDDAQACAIRMSVRFIDPVMRACVALALWDHAGAFMDMPVGQVRDCARADDPAAVLMMPAVIALNQRN